MTVTSSSVMLIIRGKHFYKEQTYFILLFLFVASSGSIVPEGGSIIGEKCHVTGSLPAETVSLSLKVINLAVMFFGFIFLWILV